MSFQTSKHFICAIYSFVRYFRSRHIVYKQNSANGAFFGQWANEAKIRNAQHFISILILIWCWHNVLIALICIFKSLATTRYFQWHNLIVQNKLNEQMWDENPLYLIDVLLSGVCIYVCTVHTQRGCELRERDYANNGGKCVVIWCCIEVAAQSACIIYWRTRYAFVCTLKNPECRLFYTPRFSYSWCSFFSLHSKCEREIPFSVTEWNETKSVHKDDKCHAIRYAMHIQKRRSELYVTRSHPNDWCTWSSRRIKWNY